MSVVNGTKPPTKPSLLTGFPSLPGLLLWQPRELVCGLNRSGRSAVRSDDLTAPLRPSGRVPPHQARLHPDVHPCALLAHGLGFGAHVCKVGVRVRVRSHTGASFWERVIASLLLVGVSFAPKDDSAASLFQSTIASFFLFLFSASPGVKVPIW